MECAVFTSVIQHESVFCEKYYHFTTAVKSFNICPGLSDQFISGCIEHSVPKLFPVDSITPSYPPRQSAPSCMMLINNCNNICSACIAIESKETSSLRKRIN